MTSEGIQNSSVHMSQTQYNDEKNEKNEKILVENIDDIGEITDINKKKFKYILDKETEIIITQEFLEGYLEDIKKKSNSIYPNLNIDCKELAKSVLVDLKHLNTWADIKEVITDIAVNLSSLHYDYDKFAVYITVTDLHNKQEKDYSIVLEQLNKKQNKNAKYALISNEYYNFAKENVNIIQQSLNYNNDYLYNFIGLKTLVKSYLKRDKEGKIIELPQHYIMRVAIAIHMKDNAVDKAIETYNYMSNFYFTHATPTLFNAGTAFPQMSSCFLLSGGVKDFTKTDLSKESYTTNKSKFFNDLSFVVGKKINKSLHSNIIWFMFLLGLTVLFKPIISFLLVVLFFFLNYGYNVYSNRVSRSYDSDDMKSIGNTWKDVAVISKHAGGIGISIADIRASGTYITSTQGKSSGYRMINVFNDIARYADQGGKRPGAFAIYTEPWHADIEYFLRAKLPTGEDTEHALDLFYGLWTCDLFMERVANNDNWSLMCPHECPGLTDSYGEKFNELYTKYEREGKAKKVVKAVDIWKMILFSQQMTGSPYMLYKDAVNIKNNQKNLGTIKCSNLCSEIVEYSNPNEYAVCNLASIALPKFIKNGSTLTGANVSTLNSNEFNVSFDFEELRKIAGIIAVNLDKIIDGNFYPVPQTEVSNMRNRPIGIGIQGLADTFIKMRMPFDSKEASQLNKDIFETIYYGAMEASINRAKELGTYPSYEGSYFSEGKFQFDLWNIKPSKWNWEPLRQEMIKYGVRNSLLTTCMPTASTSRILGFNECIEPFTSNIYRKETNAGHFTVFNEYMMKDLMDLGLWNENIRNKLKLYDGSIQNITEIPKHIRDLYKTVWEIDPKELIRKSADRGPYIDQTQSLNLFIADPSFQNMTDVLFYGWKKGLKTGMYYLRSKPKSAGTNFGLDKETEKQLKNEGKVCMWRPGMSQKEKEECMSCSA